MSNSYLLNLQKITREYQIGTEKVIALQPIDLTVKQGQYLSISGPSGCGKSTLLSIIGLLDIPSGGQYFIKDTDVTALDVDQLAALRNLHFGFIFQSFHLIDELTVAENVALPLRYRANISDAYMTDSVRQALEKVQMDHRAAFKPNQLSGGQQQRIAIARALAGNPSVLLVDEPTGNLDSKNGDAVMHILDELNASGTTICMVTHDPRYAQRASLCYQLLDGGLSVVGEDSLVKEVV